MAPSHLFHPASMKDIARNFLPREKSDKKKKELIGIEKMIVRRSARPE